MFTKKGIFKGLAWALVVGVVALIAIQFIPVDRTNPSVVAEPNWDSPATRAYAERACFDCHSNETKWPWYSYVAPISWSVADHVHEGRAKFNMSEWPSGEGDEAAKTVQKGEMPLWEYTLIHSEARLSETERQAFVAGLEKTFGSEEGEEAENRSGQPRAESDDEAGESDD